MGVAVGSRALHDLNIDTGYASNQRRFRSFSSTPAEIEFSGNGILYLVTANGEGVPVLHSVSLTPDVNNRVLVETQFSLDTGGAGIEGGMAFHPMTGKLYYIEGDSRGLFCVDITAESTTPIGVIPLDPSPNVFNDFSDIAFDNDGRLFAYERNKNLLLEIDPDTAGIVQQISLTGFQPERLEGREDRVGGLAFHPETGVLYFAHGTGANSNAFNNEYFLYTINVDTGVMSEIGTHTIPGGGLSGITFVPRSAIGN